MMNDDEHVGRAQNLAYMAMPAAGFQLPFSTAESRIFRLPDHGQGTGPMAVKLL